MNESIQQQGTSRSVRPAERATDERGDTMWEPEEQGATHPKAIMWIAAGLIASAAIGVATGWGCAWMLNQADEQNNLLWGAAMIPTMAVGLFGSIMAGPHPAIGGVVFLAAMAGTMGTIVVTG